MPERPDSPTMWSVCSLLGEYCVTMDSGRFEEWTELFTPDGRMEMARRSIEGHARLLTFAQTSPRGIHLCGLPVITQVGDAIASTCPWTFVDLVNGTQVVGYYHDDIVWSEGRHRFRTRRIEMHIPPNPWPVAGSAGS